MTRPIPSQNIFVVQAAHAAQQAAHHAAQQVAQHQFSMKKEHESDYENEQPPAKKHITEEIQRYFFICFTNDSIRIFITVLSSYFFVIKLLDIFFISYELDGKKCFYFIQ